MNINTLLNNFPDQTVFRTVDIATLLGKPVSLATNSLIHYYIHSKQLIRLSKGLYVFSTDYSREELGNKMRVPSYISFTTILQQEGLLFQPYPTIMLAANRSEKKEVDGQKYHYRKLKDSILLNSDGLKVVNNISKATPERALLDWWYLDGEQPIDRPQDIDWNRLAELNQQVYTSKHLEEYIKKGA